MPEQPVEYKKIEASPSQDNRNLVYRYWLDESGEGDADHVLVVKMEQVMRNYAAGLFGICPECAAQGIYSPMRRSRVMGLHPTLPAAVIDTCIKCSLHFNQLFFYRENQQQ